MFAAVKPLLGLFEPLAALTHLAGAVCVSLLARGLLRAARGDPALTRALRVFLVTAVYLLAMSGLYHSFEGGSPARAFFQRLDHAGIWLLVAGGFAPLQLLVLPTRLGRLLLLLVWGVALTGATTTLLFHGAVPAWVTVLCYVGFASVGAPIAVWLVISRGLRWTLPFFLGGVTLSIGALVELIEEPALVPGYIEYHELVHLAVLGGLSFHWSFIQRIALARAAANAPGETCPAPTAFEAASTSTRVASGS